MKKAENVSSEPIDVTDTNAFFFKLTVAYMKFVHFSLGNLSYAHRYYISKQK